MSFEKNFNHFLLFYSIVRTFVTLPPPFSDGKQWKPRKSLVNSDFKLEKSGKKGKLWYL